MTQEFIMFIIGQAVTAAGVYSAIRADLREALTRISSLERQFERMEDRP